MEKMKGMIAKIRKGKGFDNTLRYVLRLRACDRTKEKPEQIAGTVCEDNFNKLKTAFDDAANRRPDIRAPVWHCSLSANPKDGRLSREKWESIIDSFLYGRHLNFPNDMLWIAVRHSDKAHDHVHIVASRVRLSGHAWDDGFDFQRAKKATEAIERKFGLEITRESQRIKRKDCDYQRETHQERMSYRRLLQEILNTALAFAPEGGIKFRKIMEANGVQIVFRFSKNGKCLGTIFEYEGYHFKKYIGKSTKFYSTKLRFQKKKKNNIRDF